MSTPVEWHSKLKKNWLYQLSIKRKNLNLPDDELVEIVTVEIVVPWY
jgi:hypothetical protein